MQHLLKGLSFSILFCLFNDICFSQASIYPRDYFRDPLDIPIQLVSNFGELRPNHFHMGLDIRTQGRENLPVHAAAEGYISRIKIEKGGFGNAIYINHPNGYTTLYAHLNSFYPELYNYIKTKEYKEQKWEQDFELPANMFPIKKGQFIALSGSTGASGGPHLHFEIRDTKTGNNLNPLLFGLNVPDNKPPVIKALYWYDRRYSTYISSGKQISFIKKNNVYTVTTKVVKINSPLVSFGISTEDLSNSSGFNLGVYKAELYMDDSLMNAFTLNNFSYTDTRYVNACIDYSKLMKEKKYVQYFAILPGNKMNIFTPTSTNGVIILSDTLQHSISIKVKDAAGNATSINFFIQLNKAFGTDPYPSNAQPLLPNQENFVKGNSVRVSFTKNAFYDVVPFVLNENINANKNNASAFVALHNYTVPVHDSFTVQLKTTLAANDPSRKKVVMQLISGTSKQVKNGDWNGDWMSAKFNKLGFVQLLVDNVVPTITPVGWKNGAILSAAKRLVLKCKDDLGEIDSFRAELDGQWLMFAKRTGDNFIYTFDEHCSKGSHTLKVTVTDVAGNITTTTYTFKR
jgi:hypothetical protein